MSTVNCPNCNAVLSLTVASSNPPSGGGGGGTPPTNPPTVPPGTTVMPLPWQHTAGLPNVRINPGQTIAFAITPPAGSSSHGALQNFSIAPTGGADYFPRWLSISDKPGDFSGVLAPQSVNRGNDALGVYFSVAGYPMNRWGQPDKNNANLNPGQTYYVNVKQDDPAQACTINYGLAV